MYVFIHLAYFYSGQDFWGGGSLRSRSMMSFSRSADCREKKALTNQPWKYGKCDAMADDFLLVVLWKQASISNVFRDDPRFM